MLSVEKRTSRLSLFGRTADALTRRVIYHKELRVSIFNTQSQPLFKQDNFFVIPDLEPITSEYVITIESFHYQTKIIRKSFPGPQPQELVFEGEDEFYTIIDAINPTDSTINFSKISFLPLIPKGSQVIGPGATTALADDFFWGGGGEDVTLALLEDTSGLASSQILRFVRSANLLMRPGPYYRFGRDMTVLILKVVADSTDNPPIETAQITITEINGNPIADTTVGTLDIKTVELDPGPPPIIEIMGTEKDIQTLTNVRGDAVFYYPADTLINQLTLNTSKAGFTPDTRNVNLHAGQRIFEEIRLSAI